MYCPVAEAPTLTEYSCIHTSKVGSQHGRATLTTLSATRRPLWSRWS